jgi:hypothetical protein
MKFNLTFMRVEIMKFMETLLTIAKLFHLLQLILKVSQITFNLTPNEIKLPIIKSFLPKQFSIKRLEFI